MFNPPIDRAPPVAQTNAEIETFADGSLFRSMPSSRSTIAHVVGPIVGMKASVPSVIEINSGERGSRCQLRLRVASNRSEGWGGAAFRVRTTTPDRYGVTPNVGVVKLQETAGGELRGEAIVEIILRESIPKHLEENAIDRFAVSTIGLPLSSPDLDRSQLKALSWKSADRSTSKLVMARVHSERVHEGNSDDGDASERDEERVQAVDAKTNLLKDLETAAVQKRNTLDLLEIEANRRESVLVAQEPPRQYRFALPFWAMLCLFAVTLAVAHQFRIER